MSNVMDDLAEITRARQERERLELESRHDVEYALFMLTDRTPDHDFIFQVARAKGSCTVTEGDRTVGVVTYVSGLYGLDWETANYSQEG